MEKPRPREYVTCLKSHSRLGAACLSGMLKRSGQSPWTSWLLPRRECHSPSSPRDLSPHGCQAALWEPCSPLQCQGPFPAWPWQGHLFPSLVGEDTIPLAFCASKNSVKSQKPSLFRVQGQGRNGPWGWEVLGITWKGPPRPPTVLGYSSSGIWA